LTNASAANTMTTATPIKIFLLRLMHHPRGF
jgi:hypothetical protein